MKFQCSVYLVSLVLTLLVSLPVSAIGDQTVSTNIEPLQITGDSVSNAINLDVGGTYSDSFPGPSTNDGYWIKTTAGQNNLKADLEFGLFFDSGSEFSFNLYDANLEVVDVALQNIDNSYLYQPGLLGEYFIELYPISGSGNFDFSINLVQQQGSTAFSAMSISLDGTITSSMPGPGSSNQTYFLLQGLNPEFPTAISLSGPLGTDFDLYVETTSETPIISNTNDTYPKELEITGQSGNVNVKIVPTSGSGSYNLTIDQLIPPGYDFENAIPLTLGESVGDIFEDGGLDDFYYSLDLIDNPSSYSFSLSGDLGTDFEFRIYDEFQDLVQSITEGTYPRETSLVNIIGDHFVKVSSGGSEGSFSLQVDQTDPKGSRTNPISLPLDTTLEATSPGNHTDGANYYFLDLLAGVYRFTLEGLSVDSNHPTGFPNITASIEIENGSIIDTVTINDFTTNTITLNLPQGQYYVGIKTEHEGTMYGIKSSEIAPGSDQANPLQVGGNSYGGTFNQDAPADTWLAFALPEAQISAFYELTCESEFFATINAYKKDGSFLATADTTTCSPESKPKVTISTPPEQIIIQVESLTIPPEVGVIWQLIQFCAECNAEDALGTKNNPIPVEVGDTIMGSTPGIDSDGSNYYELNDEDLDLFEYIYEVFEGHTAKATLTDSDGNEISTITTDTSYSEVFEYIPGGILIEVSSELETDYQFSIESSNFGDSHKFPIQAEGNTYSGEFDDDGYVFVEFDTEITEDEIVVLEISCNDPIDVSVSISDTNANEVANIEGIACSSSSGPKIPLEVSLTETIVELSADDPPAAIGTGFQITQTITAPPTPSFTWSLSGELAADPNAEGLCKEEYIIQLDFSWSDHPDGIASWEILVAYGDQESVRLDTGFFDVGGDNSHTVIRSFNPVDSYVGSEKAIKITASVTLMGETTMNEESITAECSATSTNSENGTVTISDTNNINTNSMFVTMIGLIALISCIRYRVFTNHKHD